MITKELQPGYGLWKEYKPEKAPHRFRARTEATARTWQKRTRRELEELLGSERSRSLSFLPKRLERIDKGDYVREKVVIRVSKYAYMPIYILLPKGVGGPLPVVVALHGHGYGVKDIVGLWEDGAERNTPEGYHKDFAVQLCRSGFAVAAPEISCFGERQTDFSHLNVEIGQPIPSTCTHTAMLAFHLGKSVIGLRVSEGRRLVDYLQTRSEFDVSRLGAMGISGGGMHTFFSSCLDTRFKACVVSGYYGTFQGSVLSMNHCACNFAPGLHRFGEMYDLIGLLAPRPVLIEAANYDNIFPLAEVKKSVSRARKVYDVFGAKSNIETDYFEGRHQISGAKAYDFLSDHLR